MTQIADDKEKEKLNASFIENTISPSDPIIEEAPQKTSIFDTTSDPARNLSSIFNTAAADQPAQQKEASSLFGITNKEKTEDNPFFNSANRGLEQKTSLSGIIQSHTANNLFKGSQATTTSSIFPGAQAQVVNPFMPTEAPSKPALFNTGTSLFSQITTPTGTGGGLFSNMGAQASGGTPASTTTGLFGSLGSGAQTTSGLFSK